jgi:Tfp pilus assembly protein PilO
MAKHGSLILAFIIALSGVITSYAVNTERTKNNAEASANNRGEIESVKAQMVTREILQLHVEPIKTDIGEIKEVNKRLLKYLENQKDGPQ